MLYRRFGRTNLKIPVFSCGGMRYQDGWKDKPFSEIDPKTQVNLEATIRRSLEVGINHIETARGYGPSERQLGKLLPGLPRDQFIVQTKVGPTADPEEFRSNVLDSLERLQMESVDLFAIHGINNAEKLEWATRPGGCFDMAERLRSEGRFRYIGFSTHAGVDVIQKAIAYDSPESGKGFDYINLHWYYIYQETTACIQAATARDMGIFIISPSDKGGMLYQAPPILHELCDPLHPITFNDLFCLLNEQVHTLSVGAARPTDFNEHLDTLPLLANGTEVIGPILERLRERYESVIEEAVRDPWALGLPRLAEMPGNINVARIVQLRNLARAFDLLEYGKMRYNLLGNAEDWFPGKNSSPENLEPVKTELEALFRSVPAGRLLMPILEEAHELLYREPVKRLSESD